MPPQRRRGKQLNLLAKTCWAQEVFDIYSLINSLYDSVINQCIFDNWSIFNIRVRQLIKKFYQHCLDHVNLTNHKQLFNYGQHYCFEHCTLRTLLYFQVLFPVFPSQLDEKASIDICKIIDCLVSTYFKHAE